MNPRKLSLCSFFLTAVLPAQAQITIDGQLDASYGKPLAVQLAPTGFGDNTDSDPLTANGSELDAAYSVVRDGKLYLLLTGNLETIFNKLDIFIDSGTGGQTMLRNDHPDVDLNGLNAMAGLTFDADFAADYFFTIGGGVQEGGAELEFFASFAALGSTGYGVGSGSFTSFPHAITLPSSATGRGEDHVIRFALDNSNLEGVTDTSAAVITRAAKGLEMEIPLELIGLGVEPIRICAFINNSNHTFVSNQLLGSLNAPAANLGDPAEINFQTLPGNQYFEPAWQVTIATDQTPIPLAGSLRQTINDAPSGSTITFDPSLAGQTVVLDGAEIPLMKKLVIDGFDLRPGITLDGDEASRIFSVGPGGELRLSGLTLTGGNGEGAVASGSGGAVHTQGKLEVQFCLFVDNSAASKGGAIWGDSFFSGSSSFHSSTFTRNHAGVEGGAVVMGDGLVADCTIIGNSVAFYLGGGGLTISEGEAVVRNCILVENTADLLRVDIKLIAPTNGSLHLEHEGGNIIPTLVSEGSFSTFGPTFLTANPNLAPLGDYGGPTRCRPPLPGSIAIDAGQFTGQVQDQRGALGNVNGRDIGAVEFQPAVVTTAADQLDLPEGPELSLREAMAREYVSSITFDPAVFDEEPEDVIQLTLGQLVVDQSINLFAENVGGTTIDANGATTGHRVMKVTDAVHHAEFHAVHFTGGTTPPNPELNGEFGGGILNEGRLILNSCSIHGNTTGSGATGAPGGGIYNSGNLSIRGGSIHDNTTGSGNNGATGPGGDGGGIFNAGFLEVSTGTLIQSNVTGAGTPRGNGGGIANIGELEVKQSTLAENRAGRGGGIWNELGGSMTVEYSTIHSNFCNLAGGGIRNGTDSDATIVACTLFDNTAGSDAGALYAGGTVEVVGSTVIGNRAVNRDAGGIFVAASFSIRDSIVADNEAPDRGPDLVHRYGPGPVALGVNLLSDLTDSSLTAGPSILVGDPLLAPLGDHGGLTLTMPPLPGSPAFDAAGTTNPGGTDQRGLPRFANGALDIGAVEFQGALELNYFWPTDWDGDGVPYGVEFTLGTDPMTSDRGNPRTPLAIGGEFPGIQFGLNRDFIQYLDVKITRSYDLQGAWTPIATFDQAGNLQSLVPNLRYVPFTEIPGVSRLNELQPEGDRAFYRIETTPRP